MKPIMTVQDMADMKVYDSHKFVWLCIRRGTILAANQAVLALALAGRTEKSEAMVMRMRWRDESMMAFLTETVQGMILPDEMDFALHMLEWLGVFAIMEDGRFFFSHDRSAAEIVAEHNEKVYDLTVLPGKVVTKKKRTLADKMREEAEAKAKGESR